MKPARKVSRRSFMGRVVGGVVTTGAMATISGEALAFQRRTGITDTDSGQWADRAGEGRGGPGSRRGGGEYGTTDNDPTDRTGEGRGRSGITDRDSGQYADPAGNGRGGQSGRTRTGVTDADRGATADPAGYGRDPPGQRGRTRTGLTDSDIGANEDPVGYGRRRTGVTDADRGTTADRAGYGRNPPPSQRGRRRTGLTDADIGVDAPGYGRQGPGSVPRTRDSDLADIGRHVRQGPGSVPRTRDGDPYDQRQNEGRLGCSDRDSPGDPFFGGRNC